ncbi:hypothetical protein GCM10009798_23380 [Nocardioides panacihumi]|uniref:Uncharacterized protein n=1 Tax=Nocardioides panacihumi TaxID=400774 RepID=A0ABN2R3M8_9ACTN
MLNIPPSPLSVRSAHARLAALRKYRAKDDPRVVEARRDLVMAQAAALVTEAAALIAGQS